MQSLRDLSLLLLAAQSDALRPSRRAVVRTALSGGALSSWPLRAKAEEAAPKFRRLPQTQFIAALGNPADSAGTGADTWGLWTLDPGPRGVRLRGYDKLVSDGGKAPAGWTFDSKGWWLEEHGLIMEPPGPLPARRYARDGAKMKVLADSKRYVVTGAREVTSVLRVRGDGRRELSKGCLCDGTHLPCRSALYSPAGESGGTCSPAAADKRQFPVTPGGPMPPVPGCAKQDYAVLFVVGVED